ncbi:phage portal protein, partial [Candidatus Bathyarchaeota archaeon]
MANLPTLGQRFRRGWNAFLDKKAYENFNIIGGGYSGPNYRTILSTNTEQSIISPILNRAAVDISMIPLRHSRVDENNIYKGTIDSGLNNCLSLTANIDQTAYSFMVDVAMSLFDEGIIAVVPVDTSISILDSSSFEILSLRTGKIIQWYPRHVLVRLYNDNTGQREDLTLLKSSIAIVENPLYSVMNEPNSTLKRLVAKLNLLDAIDNQSGSGKLDLIMQVPYAIRSEQKRELAEKRLAALETQLKDSKYGVAYADAT